ncbi:tensin-4 isoform X3 [Cavia porcellus]|uniref:tensin-4 isoform X3 n=1 Tax=Cavia porcellus TaxID=10141 RepID=UPI000C87AB12|nr:tensin-4 isoform X3 [Cavia porcellus]
MPEADRLGQRPSMSLAGGHTVRPVPHAEPRTTLHSAPSPSLPAPCPYYTTEGWGAQALMAPTPSKGPPSPVQQTPEPHGKASGTPQDLDSYVDFSLETLNQMILELDPTFQLLPPGLEGPQAQAAQSQDSRSKEEPKGIDIKYIEVTSPGRRYHDSSPCCSSPSVTPPFGSPRSGGLLCRDVPRETRSSSESLIFSGSQGRASSPCSSPSIAIPCVGGRASGPPGSGSPLITSPGLEKGLTALMPHRGSRVSMLSASPGSDVSYVFGSSQSLVHSSSSGHQSSLRSLESPASSSSSLHSLGSVSPCTRPSDVQAPSNPTSGMVQPRTTHSLPLATEHPSSCPSSITNSMVDIPIVLINGCPEPQSPPLHQTSGHQGLVQAGAAPPKYPCPATESCSQTLPDSLSAMAPTNHQMMEDSGPARDTQPTMKFVMDTSKYWFKPSITREQAIELLKKEEPGAFVIRDSSSYRGSFGLALKVPASAQHRSAGEDSSDLIRHFLIESSAKGVHLKGADEEPYFGSLSAFVCQHSIMALALPCPLAIPQQELGAADGAADLPTDNPACLKQSAGSSSGVTTRSAPCASAAWTPSSGSGRSTASLPASSGLWPRPRRSGRRTCATSSQSTTRCSRPRMSSAL